MSSSKKRRVDQPHSDYRSSSSGSTTVSTTDKLTIYVDGNKTKSEKKVIQMDDSMHLFDQQDSVGLYTAFSNKGYLLLRGFLDQNAVESTRKSLIDSIQHMGKCDGDGNATIDSPHGYIINAPSGAIISGQDRYTSIDDSTQGETKSWQAACQQSKLDDFFSNERILSLFRLLAEGKGAVEGGVKHTPLIFNDHAWLRVKTSKEFTKSHADFFYWKNDTDMFRTPPVDSTQTHKCAVCGTEMIPTDEG